MNQTTLVIFLYDKPQYRRGNKLLANPISFGTRAPQACTSHTLCIPSTHSRTITKMMQRVKSGSRKMYERMRAAENCGRLGAIVAFGIALF